MTSRTDSRMNIASSRVIEDLDACRQRLRSSRPRRARLRDIDGIGLRLADDVDADRRLAIEAGDRRRS